MSELSAGAKSELMSDLSAAIQDTESVGIAAGIGLLLGMLISRR